MRAWVCEDEANDAHRNFVMEDLEQIEIHPQLRKLTLEFFLKRFSDRDCLEFDVLLILFLSDFLNV